MIVQLINKNLLETEHQFIVHGCNCAGVMGSGVAKAIREKYPKAYDDYVEFIDDQIFFYRGIPGGNLLGSVNYSLQDDGITIVNALTQDSYGKDGKKYVSYDAIDQAFRDINAKLPRGSSVAIPMIGAGLGGGNWKIIQTIIDEVTPDLEIYVYYI